MEKRMEAEQPTPLGDTHPIPDATLPKEPAKPVKHAGLSSLATLSDNTMFSVIDAIGGVRGVIESMLPGLLFVICFVITRNVQITVIASAALALLQVLARLVQRQSLMGAVSGLISVAICLVWVWTSNQARDYYMMGFITNAVYGLALLISLIVRVPALGLVIEAIRHMPTEHYRQWLNTWMSDKPLKRAYTQVTVLWIVVFSLRLALQVPLYVTNNVVLLGTVRLLMGLPFWALAIWISYLIIATPFIRFHHAQAESTDEHECAK